jgi:hypothetical protein
LDLSKIEVGEHSNSALQPSLPVDTVYDVAQLSSWSVFVNVPVALRGDAGDGILRSRATEEKRLNAGNPPWAAHAWKRLTSAPLFPQWLAR